MKEEAFCGGPKGGVKKRIRRGRVSLTQYLESQEHQGMTKLTPLQQNSRQEKRECFYFGMEKMRGLYNSGRKNMNGKTFNKS